MKKIIALLLTVIMIIAMTACGSQEPDEGEAAKDTMEYTVDEQAVELTIMGEGNDDVVYTADDFEKMGLTENAYSGRNKKVLDARQFMTFEGIEVNELLKAAGYETEGAKLTVICSDGYTKEYDVAKDLYGKYTFADNETDNKTEVVPMIALVNDEEAEYPAPFKLVFGQADYDNNESQDFNMQGWLSYIQCIKVTY